MMPCPVVSSKGDILFAGHSERYSKYKHDKNLSAALIKDAAVPGRSFETEIHYYDDL